MRKFIVTSVAFDAQQSGEPEAFSPPDLCCPGQLGTTLQMMLSLLRPEADITIALNHVRFRATV
jgi:hypothetical protein